MFSRITVVLLLGISANTFADVSSTFEKNISLEPRQEKHIINIPYVNLDKIINIFLGAVEIGELEVLDLIIERKQLAPIKVELVYGLKLQDPLIKIISNVNPPIPLPHIGNLYITTVSATMDLNGNIIDSAAQVEY